MLRPDQIQPLYDKGLIREDQRDAFMKRLAPELVESVIKAESAGNPEAVSPKGATGLMQVMPATGAEVAQKLGMQNYDLKNPEDNRKIGEAYLGQMQQQFGDDGLALAAYNWGPGNVQRAMQQTGAKTFDDLLAATDATGNPILPRETRDYVPKVLQGQGVSETAASKPAQPQGQAQSITDPIEIQKDAIEKATAAGVYKAAEEASLREELVKKQEQFALENMERENQRREALEQYETEVKLAIDDLKGTQVDSERWWKNKSTGGKVMAALAMGLGAFGAALTRTRNTAFDIIQTAINNDIAEQRLNLAGKREAVAEKRGIVSQMRARFSDERVADRLATAAVYENVQAKLEQLQSTYQGQKAAADGQLLYGQLEAAKVQALAGARKAQEEMVTKQQELQLKVNKDDREERKLKAETPANRKELIDAAVRGDVDSTALPKDLEERFIDGYGVAKTKEDAREFKEIVASTMQSEKLLDQLEEVIKNNEGQVGVVSNPLAWGTRGKVKTIRQQLVGALRKPILGPGMSSDQDMKRVESMVPDPFAFGSSDESNLVRLNQLRNDLKDKMEAYRATYGLSKPPEIRDR
jgi:hypothetical protein